MTMAPGLSPQCGFSIRPGDDPPILRARFYAANTHCQFGTQEYVSPSLVCDAAYNGESKIDGGRRIAAPYADVRLVKG